MASYKVTTDREDGDSRVVVYRAGTISVQCDCCRKRVDQLAVGDMLKCRDPSGSWLETVTAIEQE